MWRILIVDDEPDVRMIVSTTLKQNYEIFEAHDGLDALEKLERVQPDFVVMDVMMPLMDGFQACDAIRKSPNYSTLAVMFLTALNSKEDMKKGYGVGANLYLTKPFDPSRLLKNVDVFFQTTPPPKVRKRYTYEQLKEAERIGQAPVAPGAMDFDIHSRETRPEGTPTPAEISPDTDIAPRTAVGPRPVSIPAPQAMPPTTPMVPHQSMTPRIMVVDDEPSIIELIRLTLGPSAEVVSAADGISAIEKLVKYQPDMLIIDVMLPKVSGYKLCESLRSNAAFAHLPIMICSAKGTDRDIQFARKMGANDYLVKPFNSDELLGKIRSMQTLPGFRIRPKNLSFEQINLIDAPGATEVFAADESVRRTEDEEKKRKSAIAPQTSDKALGDFIRREAASDKADEEPKKKRRLFGFGKSD